jgi:hypothetical protein
MERLALLLQQAITAEKVALKIALKVVLPVTPPGELSNNAATETQHVQQASQIVQENLQIGIEFDRSAARPRGGMAHLA